MSFLPPNSKTQEPKITVSLIDSVDDIVGDEIENLPEEQREAVKASLREALAKMKKAKLNSSTIVAVDFNSEGIKSIEAALEVEDDETSLPTSKH
ncbi:MAG: hypothetical protein FWG98_10315 [Candidatus Cloacimonetes bacterium]|nr:hypothetical protein [Candidatus Cloacimonadota bacterium]